jgi:hypothetical protein
LTEVQTIAEKVTQPAISKCRKPGLANPFTISRGRETAIPSQAALCETNRRTAGKGRATTSVCSLPTTYGRSRARGRRYSNFRCAQSTQVRARLMRQVLTAVIASRPAIGDRRFLSAHAALNAAEST